MPDLKKYEKILDSLQQLLEQKNIQNISVSEIASNAGMGKGSIYYYFPSKNAIVEALIKRNYEKPLQIAKHLVSQSDISPFTRMAMLFQACRNSSSAFLNQNNATEISDAQNQALLHQKYLNYLISELKPELAEIIKQGIERGEIHFNYPETFSEIVLIVIVI